MTVGFIIMIFPLASIKPVRFFIASILITFLIAMCIIVMLTLTANQYTKENPCPELIKAEDVYRIK